jgi:hypothetical protein
LVAPGEKQDGGLEFFVKRRQQWVAASLFDQLVGISRAQSSNRKSDHRDTTGARLW